MDAAGSIALPDPCLVVLIGAAGSGKSTLAARLFEPKAILSSDTFRAIVSGNESDQRATRAAFGLLNRQLERRLAAGQTTVVDATSVTPFSRRVLLKAAAAHGIPVVALVLDLDPELVVARNAARAGRVVPEAAVRRQLADLERSLRSGALDSEGFAETHRYRTPDEIDALTVTMRR